MGQGQVIRYVLPSGACPCDFRGDPGPSDSPGRLSTSKIFGGLPAAKASLCWQVTTRVNGEVMQSEKTADMIFSCAECIAWLSNNMTLMPGAVILTGTCSGIAAGRTPPNWLRAGDVVECEIEKIGVLRNTAAHPPDIEVAEPSAKKAKT